MRKPDELDYAQLTSVLERQAKQSPGSCVSIRSPAHGLLCGFVPNEITNAPVRLVLSDSYFDPYLRG